ncbi:unnamed protein product [Colias eurytheme]|nr:unnamed protein product [Colias eurytheme]
MAISKITEHNFQEVRCGRVFEAMRQCCLKHKPVSLVCEGYSLEPRVFAPVTDRADRSSGQLSIDLVKTLTQISECVILFVISLAFGTDKQTLPFALFCQSFVLVAYNSVMTSQYFIWFLSLLPLVVHDLRMKPKAALFLAILWVLPQAKWLYYAYLLEFKSQEIFFYIWTSGIFFFVENIYILSKLVKSYSPSYGFGQISDSEIKNK